MAENVFECFWGASTNCKSPLKEGIEGSPFLCFYHRKIIQIFPDVVFGSLSDKQFPIFSENQVIKISGSDLYLF